MPVADLVGELVRDRGWDERLNVQRVFTDWPAVVGADVAAHSTVEGIRRRRPDGARRLDILGQGTAAAGARAGPPTER